MTTLTLELGKNSYPIVIGKGLLARASEFFNLSRNVFIVTDDGVPNKYSETIKLLCKNATIKTVNRVNTTVTNRLTPTRLVRVPNIMADAGITHITSMVVEDG